MASSVALTLLGLLMMFISRDSYMLVSSFLILGVPPHGLTYPVSVVQLSRTFDESGRAAANSLFFSVMMILSSALPFLLGLLVSYIGIRLSFAALMPVVAAIAVALAASIRSLQGMPERGGAAGTQGG
ncbi:hypothetical protein [Thermogymnomonas acidicola]|uniref:hypothetical protein n=1 Tax=Thermogymnomonas acidicola TaxID=399579 RepID=UPI00139686B7|nr:hypothetical protein [Thermogymnomonas acidicola]